MGDGVEAVTAQHAAGVGDGCSGCAKWCLAACWWWLRGVVGHSGSLPDGAAYGGRDGGDGVGLWWILYLPSR